MFFWYCFVFIVAIVGTTGCKNILAVLGDQTFCLFVNSRWIARVSAFEDQAVDTREIYRPLLVVKHNIVSRAQCWPRDSRCHIRGLL